jgi:hypothetical protein
MAASVAEPTGALLLQLFKAYLPKRYARRSSSVPFAVVSAWELP